MSYPQSVRSLGSTRPTGWKDYRSYRLCVDELHEELFSEVTYHAAYEPQRAVRTARYKYIRRFDERHRGRVVANLDDGLTKMSCSVLVGPTSTHPAAAVRPLV
jgi:hypothetical protein